MPACFQLIKRSDEAAGPVRLTVIDEELCQHFGVPVDPVKYMGDWYDMIGFRLAIGKSFAEIREEFLEHIEEFRAIGREALFYEDALRILEYLETNFLSNSFYSR